MKIRILAFLSSMPILWATALAQSAPANQASAPAVPYASVSQLNLLLSDLQQASQATQLDLAKLRIEKWKTDGNTKHGTDSDVESIQRNLQTALPELIARLRESPENLSATFKLYRNLDALYDVFGSVTESAGAFGSKDEFQWLQNDLGALQRARRSFADRMEALSDGKEAELTNLRTQLQNAKAAEATAPLKKTVVDDTETAKKPVAKKKTPPKNSKTTTSTSAPKASPGTAASSPDTPPPQNPQ